MISFTSLHRSVLFCAVLVLVAGFSEGLTQQDTIRVQVTPFKVHRGDTVKIEIQLLKTGASTPDLIHLLLLKPSQGSFELPIQKAPDRPDVYQGEMVLSDDAPEGLYAIHAWTGSAEEPSAVGKGFFLLGKIVADFFYPTTIDNEQPDQDISQYLQGFRELGGNFLIAHGLIGGNKAHYPSKICKTDLNPGSPKDIVETLLRHGDQKGYPVLLSVSWDLTKNSPSQNRMSEIKAIMKELYNIYFHHPSLVGFYSYLEGSGTYFVPFLRAFCDYAKTLNPGLLTACAPYVDDPMLAGYISIVESLDIIIYQGMVMASFRPDNRKKYPLRRVKDFCSLGVGAKWLQNKIALTHVELFGYLENRVWKDCSTTIYENIYPQILSAATVACNDGISFFTYSSNIHAGLKIHPEIQESRKAIHDGMKAFDLIWDKISKDPNALTVYFPHSDWVIERWPNNYLPALDAFRILGMPVDILPYAPPLDEDYPYWPNHKNKAVLPRLLKNKRILILPNVSGFKRTDSDLIEDFVKQGGVIIAFGPQIPMARTTCYERKRLFGVEEAEAKVHSSVFVKETLGDRVSAGDRFFIPPVQFPLWESNGAKIVAVFEDGSPAVLVNRYGKGTVVTIAIDAKTAANRIPGLVRDVIDYAVAAWNIKRVVDILGTNENVDVAVARIFGGFRVAVVNHNPQALEITLKPLGVLEGPACKWYDLISQKIIDAQEEDFSLKLQLQGRNFLCLEFRQALAKEIAHK